jgi:hypothetical protein
MMPMHIIKSITMALEPQLMINVSNVLKIVLTIRGDYMKACNMKEVKKEIKKSEVRDKKSDMKMMKKEAPNKMVAKKK